MILSAVHVAGASLPSRTVSPSAAPRLLHRTGDRVARSFGVRPAPIRTADDSLATANPVVAPPASHSATSSVCRLVDPAASKTRWGHCLTLRSLFPTRSGSRSSRMPNLSWVDTSTKGTICLHGGVRWQNDDDSHPTVSQRDSGRLSFSAVTLGMYALLKISTGQNTDQIQRQYGCDKEHHQRPEIGFGKQCDACVDKQRRHHQ